MSLKKSYNGIPAGEVKLFLEGKYLQYNNPSFIITTDPVSIPLIFSDPNMIRKYPGFSDGCHITLGTQGSYSEEVAG